MNRKKYSDARQARLKALGLCSRCGKNPRGNKLACMSCRIKRSNSYFKRRDDGKTKS